MAWSASYKKTLTEMTALIQRLDASTVAMHHYAWSAKVCLPPTFGSLAKGGQQCRQYGRCASGGMVG